MKTRKLLRIIRWADEARKDDEFWRRVLIAGTAYPIETQIALHELVKQSRKAKSDE